MFIFPAPSLRKRFWNWLKWQESILTAVVFPAPLTPSREKKFSLPDLPIQAVHGGDVLVPLAQGGGFDRMHLHRLLVGSIIADKKPENVDFCLFGRFRCLSGRKGMRWEILLAEEGNCVV